MTCVCGSWLGHWERFSGQTAVYCGEVSCYSRDLVGAHVQRAEVPDATWYIYPLCKKHNMHKGELEVAAAFRLVPANRKDTCERR